MPVLCVNKCSRHDEGCLGVEDRWGNAARFSYDPHRTTTASIKLSEQWWPSVRRNRGALDHFLPTGLQGRVVEWFSSSKGDLTFS